MIKNILLPEKIGSYYLFPKRIVGIDIGKADITATVIRANGSSLTIEQTIEMPLETSNGNDTTERTVATLKQMMGQVGKVQEVRTALPSSVVIFKELKLPFISYDKIKLIVNFEVEPLLPFSLQDAVIDFIITKQNIEEQSSQVLVAAVQKQHVTKHLELLALADITPDVVTVDLFALYALYQAIPEYEQSHATSVVIDLGLSATRIIYIDNGQLRLIRTLSKGMIHLAKSVSDTLGITVGQAMEHIMRFGITTTDWPEYGHAITKSCTAFWQEIRFTLTSFTLHGSPEQSIKKLVLLGPGAQLKGLCPFVSELMTIPCEIFETQKINTIHHVHSKNKQMLPQSCIMSTSIALPLPLIEFFNLRRGELAASNRGLLYVQSITTAVLTLLLLGTLATYSYLQTSRLEKEIASSEEQAIEALKENFKNSVSEDITELDEALQRAQEELAREEKTWFAFSSQSPALFLKYLLELTNHVDKESLELALEKITITDGVMTLKGRVKDFPSLTTLVRELEQSKLFTLPEPQRDVKFDALKIVLAPKGKGK
jgi:type IV pilus assembly protein PilM